MDMKNKKLYRDTENKMIAGVCAGLAKYVNMDPTLIRILWVLITAFGGSGVIAYLVCMFVIPEDPGYTDYTEVNDDK